MKRLFDRYIEHHWVRFGIVMFFVIGIAVLLSFLHNEHLTAAINGIDSAIAASKFRELI